MNQQQTAEEQRIRALIGGAGPRAGVPAEDVAKIKVAARQEWRELVERERRLRRRWRLRGAAAVAAGVVLALAVGWWWTTGSGPVAAPVVASVELIAGSVRTGEAVDLQVGGDLSAGTAVVTSGWTGDQAAGAALRLAGGQSLRLAADTRVRLVSDRRFELEHGTLYVDSNPYAGAGGVEVVTALGTVRDIGTQFEVRLGEGAAAVRLRVREGEVALEAEGETYRAVRGEQLSLLGDGSIARAAVESYGPEWEWVMATAPGIEIEGLPLGSFLAWASREIGRELRYADPALAQAAATEITVHGSIAGFTPAEALATVMAGSGVRHQVENGTILITR